MNYSEPEELTIGISELDDIENKIDLEVISKEINRRDSKVGRIFELLTFHGYKLEDIARSEKLNTKLSFMSAVQKVRRIHLKLKSSLISPPKIQKEVTF